MIIIIMKCDLFLNEESIDSIWLKEYVGGS